MVTKTLEPESYTATMFDTMKPFRRHITEVQRTRDIEKVRVSICAMVFGNSIGEVLIVDKPYASVLVKEFLYMYCYHCYNRCFNLKPCSGCSFVGFCSPSCAESAMRRDGGRRDGLGRHVHDCGGLVPCLLLDNYAGWPKESKGSVGGPNVSHLAFACIGNTAPDCLLDYICSTGRYEVSALVILLLQFSVLYASFVSRCYIRVTSLRRFNANEFGKEVVSL
ncbi:set and mynd domain containing protein [Echinococcus multilocularis]|uniref:Set and mynd domain containing protein n=1 Tax=Echinococcus multilocularis TaxID=6211 RepID=A0A068YLV1_ECHMU|nr:set and mynd domain containing protein [Echinococcus multilocularis]